MRKIFIMLQKHSAELKKTTSSSDGSALSVLIIGLLGLFLMTFILLSIIDLSVYSYKKRIISQAINYGVSAAVQEIDVEDSREGLSKAFSEDGKVSLIGVYLDEVKADNAFNKTFSENAGFILDDTKGDIIRLAATPLDTGTYYSIKDRSGEEKGTDSTMDRVEDILNARMAALGSGVDNNTVFVNGNLKTNAFEKRPYYMIFIRNYQINGLFSKRKATFICFKSAKIYR